MPDLKDYHAFKSTSGDDNSNKGYGGAGGGGGFGLGWVVIVIVAILLVSFIADGASLEAIDSLLGLGFLAFLFARSLFK